MRERYVRKKEISDISIVKTFRKPPQKKFFSALPVAHLSKTPKTPSPLTLPTPFF
jgi:hypothetical protein